MFGRSLPLVLLLSTVCLAQSSTNVSSVQADKLGGTVNVHRCGSLFLAGQPNQSDIATLKQRGIKRVITLRASKEVSWDEAAAFKAVGIEFISLPITSTAITDTTFERMRELLGESKKVSTMLHCGSATRVGAVWLPYRVLDEGVDLPTAIKESKEIGLKSQSWASAAMAYIKKVQDQPKSVKPGINKRFLSPELDVDDFVERFEGESREVFASRKAVMAAIGVKPGMSIADIGAGTGLYTRQFAKATGNRGWVYAVDISPKFLAHVNKTLTRNNMNNVTGVLCDEDSVNLPPASVDIVFICDTYHHFEFPKQTLESIYKALKPGGQLVVVDFERIPGKTREWLLDHVRAGKDVFRLEIQDAGFRFDEEVKIEGFKENYFLRFIRK